MNIFVTGVAGFLGSHIAEHYRNEGHNVFGVDRLVGGDSANVPSGVDWYIGDILDTDSITGLLKKNKIDIVYHTAALAMEGLSVFSPSLISRNIFSGSVSVQSACIQAGVDHIIQCSSMARYGELKPPFTEDMECSPVDPYGLAKLSADKMLMMLGKIHGIKWSIAVPHNIVGPRQKYDDPFRNVASIMINRMLRGKQPIIYGDGSQTRCFSFIQDVLSCLTVMPFTPEANGQVINVGPDQGTITIKDLAFEIASLLDFPIDPIFMPGRPCEVKHAQCSSDKARKLLGYETQFTLREGLSQMIEHISSRGPKEFNYHVPIEIQNDQTPKTWLHRMM